MNLYQYIIGYTSFTSAAVRAAQVNHVDKMTNRPQGLMGVWLEEES